ncbi:Uncharacterised protein [Streptococcus pyogenes]|nr:Uncharacterised protein [Streptococcus pyogenes]
MKKKIYIGLIVIVGVFLVFLSGKTNHTKRNFK